MNLIIGSHVPYVASKELLGSVQTALSYGANTFMIYTGPNQSSYRKNPDKGLTDQAHQLMKKNNMDINNVIVHAPFIINLANDSDMRKYNFYVSFMKEEIQRCKLLGIKNLLLHPGNATNIEKSKALDNISFGINQILKDENDIRLIIEYMAGKGTELGCSVQDLKTIYQKIDKKDMVYFCIDTCHLNDSGVNLNEFDKFLENFDKEIGINKISCIHLNDSLNIVGSHKDRHANIGYGTIGFDNLINVVYHPLLKDLPIILETPFNGENAPYKYEIENIKNKTFNDFINQ